MVATNVANVYMQVLAYGGLLKGQPPGMHTLMRAAGLPLHASELTASGAMSAMQAAVALAALSHLGLPHSQLRQELLQVCYCAAAPQLQVHFCCWGIVAAGVQGAAASCVWPPFPTWD